MMVNRCFKKKWQQQQGPNRYRTSKSLTIYTAWSVRQDHKDQICLNITTQETARIKNFLNHPQIKILETNQFSLEE